MKTIFKILEVEESDRYIFINIDESQCENYAAGIIGVNFHQGIGHMDMDFKNPDIHVTEIWKRLTINHPNVDYYHLLDKACDLFVEAFITQTIS
jgi:hypothetical protein